MKRAAIFAIDRLRMGTDGTGITTLVTFMGCPLHCKYCLNDQCHNPIYEKDGKTPRKGVMLLTPQELYDWVKIDNIYFQATGGGICFGGGEPGLQSEFIAEFRNICGDKWKITIETCGCISWREYELLAPVIDKWIVDIKTTDIDIYEKYTGCLSGVSQHLRCLKRLVALDKVTIKIPHIPDYTTAESITESIKEVKRLGFENIEEVQYVKRIASSTLKRNNYGKR